jgi:hypothetical protein
VTIAFPEPLVRLQESAPWVAAGSCGDRNGRNVRRRDFINAIAGSLGAWPMSARAEQPPQSWRIETTTIQQRTSRPMFDQRLRELGYTDGQNLAEEFLNPDTQSEGD